MSRYMLMYIRADGTAAYEPFEGTPKMLRERLALLNSTRPEGARPAQWARLTGGRTRHGKTQP